MTTIAGLGIRVDSGDAVEAAGNLEQLVDAGSKAEVSAGKTGRAWESALLGMRGDTKVIVAELQALNAKQAELAQQMTTVGRAVTTASAAFTTAAAGLASMRTGADQAGQAQTVLGAQTDAAAQAGRRAAESAEEQQARLLAVARTAMEATDYTQTLTRATQQAADANRQANTVLSDRASQQAAVAARVQAMMATEERLANSSQSAASAQREQARELDGLLSKIDPTVAALGRLDEMEKKLRGFKASGALDGETFSEYKTKIDQAREALGGADASLNRTGMTAKATAAALRNVPAQFTDIFVSLQAGQAPLTVLLQQGGQLKDMFGGIGPAARALGGYVAGLVNPFTVAAAAVAGLSYAYYKGSEEADAYSNALILTGNSAGFTSDQLGAMAKQISGTVGTTGAASAALASIAGSGKIAGENFERVAQAAISMEVATGKAVGDTIAEFNKLADDPVKASASLNEQYNYLTASVYSQIAALEQQGRHADAVKLATNALADAINERTPKIIENLSWWERGYNAVAKAADYAKNAGRNNIDDDIAQAEKDLARAQNGDVGYLQTKEEMVTYYGDQLQFLKDKKAAQEEIAKIDKDEADANDRSLRAMERVDALEKSSWNNARKRSEALKEYERSLAAIRKTDPNDARLSPDAVARVRASIEEQYKDPKGPAYRESAGARALDQARQQYSVLQQQNALIGAQRGEMQKLGEASQALVKWEQQLADIKDKKVLTSDQKSLLANQDLVTAQLKRNAALEREMELRKLATEEARRLAAFEGNLNTQLQRAALGLNSTLAGSGLGDQAQQRLQERFSIEQQYQQQMDNLLQQRNEGRISESLYQKENAALQNALDQRLAMQEQYYLRVDEQQSDWSLGARAAFNTYLEQAQNVAGQTRSLFTNAFSNMEDAVVTFVKTGKLSFKDFADGVIEDLIRIQVRQAAAGFLGSAFGFLTGGSQALGQGTMTGYSETIASSGFSGGGYTGDGGKFEPKGVVHGGEFVLRKEVVAQPGMRNYLEGLNVRGYASGGFVTPRIASNAPSYAGSQPDASSGQMPAIHQDITVQGSADEATLARIQQAAQKGAQDGYNLVLRDLKMNGPARQLIARNR